MLLLAGLGALASCKQRYYTAQGESGNEKRDRLVEQFQKGREEQERAKAQYLATLAAFQAVPDKRGEIFKQEFDEAARRTKTISDRIATIEQVSAEMFAEWERELAGMHNGELKNKSLILVRKTRERCGELLGRMRAVEAKAKTVMKAFEDQVLFLEHSRSGGSSGKATAEKLGGEVKSLVLEIEASTREADAFIGSLPRGS
jgi:hypothetical protein